MDKVTFQKQLDKLAKLDSELDALQKKLAAEFDAPKQDPEQAALDKFLDSCFW